MLHSKTVMKTFSSLFPSEHALSALEHALQYEVKDSKVRYDSKENKITYRHE